MAQKVEIEVVATDSASTKLSNIANVVTGISSAINIAQNMFGTMQRVMDQTVNVAQDYNQQVRDMMLATGGTAEETSKLVQVVDDVGISYDTLKTAMKMASKDGIEPNLESLAQLADQYQKLAPGVERNQFLLDKFGRSGLDMARAMEQGGAALRQMSEEMDGSLVLTEENIKASEEYRKNVDQLSDSWEGLKVKIGNEAIPVLNQIMQGMENTSQAQEDYNRRLQEAIKLYGDHGDRANNMRVMMMQEQEQAWAAADAVAAHGDALMNDTVAVEENTSALEGSTAAIDAQNAAMQQALDSAMWITANQKEYNTTLQELNYQRNTELDNLEALKKRYGEQSTKVDEQKTKIGELDQKIQDLKATQEEQTTSWTLKLLEQQGATVQMQMAFAQATGIVSNGSVIATQAIDSVTQSLKDGDVTATYYRDRVKALMARIEELDGMSAYADIYVTEHGANMGSYAASINRITSSGDKKGRASGGPVSEGVPYIVGERGQEMFVPNQDGTIIPNHKLGQLGGGTMVVNLTYAPMFSTANKAEFLQNVTPLLDDWYRRKVTS